MSGAKRMLEEAEAKRGLALHIAVEAGALEVCDIHDEPFEGSSPVEDAYRLANSRWSDYQESFETRREMTDFIKDVVDDHPADSCPMCARHYDD